MILLRDQEGITDSGQEVAMTRKKPALANLITIFSHCSGRSIDEVVAAYEGKGYAEFKKDLAEVVVEALTPVQARHDAIVADGSYVEVLREGARRAHEVSSTVLRRVKEAMGLSLFIDPRSEDLAFRKNHKWLKSLATLSQGVANPSQDGHAAVSGSLSAARTICTLRSE